MKVIIRQLGIQDYEQVWQQMMQFTLARTARVSDEFWLVQHPNVFTQGLAGKAEHLIRATDIPVVQSDRGGQITYHGPGQIVLYSLVQLKVAKLSIRQLVSALEQAVIKTLGQFGITGVARQDAPGVYVDNRKIASLGLRVKKGCSYHGLSFNYHMDLTPFSYINPCGYQGLEVTQLKDLIDELPTQADFEFILVNQLAKAIGYEKVLWQTQTSNELVQ
ncbi:MAG: lipoyl(octanoyl) transferase LipB [Gammaproteobacteria bacterium]|nr:lipoyl(octanoyl) transferase LipB [Gammaproteobacteria bacterium]MDH5729641.1 lipoyl(octanoyl) transferase LipB [Gammaproteobacteria bacterium]